MIRSVHGFVRRSPRVAAIVYAGFRGLRRVFWRLRPASADPDAIPVRFVAFVAANLPDGPFALAEIGCGSGAALLELAKRFPQGRFVGVDLQSAAIRKARRAALRSGLANAEFVQSDLLSFCAKLNEGYIACRTALMYLNEKEIRRFFASAQRSGVMKILIHDVQSTSGRTIRTHYFAHPYPELFAELGLTVDFDVSIRPLEYAPWIGANHVGVEISMVRRIQIS